MGVYGGFARLYDRFMKNVPPSKWAGYAELLWKTHNIRPKLVLDLACGTGSVTRLLAKRGYDMTGIDISEDMLAAARRKNSKNILYLQQDMREFELYGTVDAIICFCDSINYILEFDGLLRVFRLVYNYLNPEGVFIFDVNTEYKFLRILKNKTFAEVEGEGAYIWENYYDKKQKLNEYFVTFFAKQPENNLYERFEEHHFERAYPVADIERALKISNLNILGKYDEFTLLEPKENSVRIFFAAQKAEVCGSVSKLLV